MADVPRRTQSARIGRRVGGGDHLHTHSVGTDTERIQRGNQQAEVKRQSRRKTEKSKKRDQRRTDHDASLKRIKKQ